MKILKTKKVNIAICWSGLRNTPPRDFPAMKEIEATPRILTAFKEAVPKFTESIIAGEQMQKDMITGKLNAEEIGKTKEEFFKKSGKIEQEEGNKIVEVEFENDEFNTFFQQFTRWGKNWFQKLEQFLEFVKDMNTTNAQPKVKEKK